MSRQTFPSMILDPDTRLFAGTFDDSVNRYPWSGYDASLQTFNRSLLFHAILGPRLCCRIGNILYHRPYLTALLDPQASPLRVFCKSGFIQLQMKGESFNDTIAVRQKNGTNSTLKFIKEFDWKPSSDIFLMIADVDRDIPYGIGKVKYSPNFTQNFHSIMDRVSAHRYEPFRRLFHTWKSEFDTSARTRSNFEELGKRVLASQPEQFKRCMQIINSANHYAYGSALKSASSGVLIETEEISILNDLTSTLLGQEENVLDVDRYDVLIRKGAFDVIGAHLAIPVSLVHDSASWNILASALTFGSDNYTKITRHKKTIFATVDRLLGSEEGAEQDQCIRDLKEATIGYSRYLFNLVGKRRESKYFMGMSFVLQKIAGDASSEMADLLKDMSNELIDVSVAAADLTSGFGTPLKYTYRLVQSILVDDANGRINRIIGSGLAKHHNPNAKFATVKEVSNAFRYPSLKIME